MALKENLNAIKQGLSTEEQFLEGMIKSERFFKKYKWTLVSGVVIVALLGVGYAITDTLKTKHLRTANEAYRAVLANPDDAVALKTLKESSSVLYGTHAAQVALILGGSGHHIHIGSGLLTGCRHRIHIGTHLFSSGSHTIGPCR